jgi:hypothetical protein
MEIPRQDEENFLGAVPAMAFKVDATRRQIQKYFDLTKESSYKDYRRWQAALPDRVVRIVHLAHALVSSCQHSPCFLAC